ncbi:solute carrier family 35 member F3-like isoform X2 [Petromyzon marinus]|nr:putative thiamine transporter SLC35F3 isoform X2 [Petromyzon marinus]
MRMKKRSARVAPLSACRTPVLSLTRSPDVESSPKEPPAAAAAANDPETDSNGNAVSRADPAEGSAGWRSALRRLAWGLLLLPAVAASWAGASQMNRAAAPRGAAGQAVPAVPAVAAAPATPFLAAWFSATWNLAVFPAYCLCHAAACDADGTRGPLQTFRDCGRLFGDGGVGVRPLLQTVLPFSLLWTGATYLYLLALARVAPTDAAALFCCNKAFVFLLSWIVLNDRFMGVRIVAAILAISGIVMTAYADGFRGDSIIGVALAVGAASASAFYKVLFKKVLGSARLGEAALFLSALGLMNAALVSSVCAALHYSGLERWPHGATAWANLCATAALILMFTVLVNFGVALTYPSIISLGVVLTIPLNAALDVRRGDTALGAIRLAAMGVIVTAFLLLLLPDYWDEDALALATSVRDRLFSPWAPAPREQPPADEGLFLGAGPGSATQSDPPALVLVASGQQ